ncbi:MAG: leucine-rich repeat domain-containing protein [Candidatus Kapaibacterium sp.]|nr:MAG: leucine-rich repeat domain-containing protein [Candidatus Kapabacteria bacterium]
MTTELQRRIAENKETRDSWLNLQGLHLTGNEPELLELADCIWLTDADFSDNDITNIAFVMPLFAMKNISSIDLRNNQISDLSPLSSLADSSKECEITLWLDGNVIEDVAPLQGVKLLDSLYLDNNRIKDLSPLKDEEYGTFSVENNLIDSISVEVPKVMDHFRFKGNPVLERMLHLLQVNRYDDHSWFGIRLQTEDQIPDDIFPYNEMNACLDILAQGDGYAAANTKEKRLQSRIMKNKQKRNPELDLSRLELTGNEPELLELSECTWLKEFDFGHNRITNFAFALPLFALENISWMRFNNNRISDLSPFASLADSRKKYPLTLSLQWNQIEDVSPLKGVKVESLMLGYNRIKDISALKDEEYGWFSVDNNLIEDITLDVPKANLAFRLRDNPVLTKMKKLLNRKVKLEFVIREKDSMQRSEMYPYDDVKKCLEILKERGEL